MKQAKNTYLTQALANHQKDSKAFWRTLKKILPKGDSKHPINLNLSVAFSIFPTAWKTATIVPIEKKTNAPTPSDFRPISLLPLPG